MFGNSVFEDPANVDVRQTITQDCYSIAKAAEGYFSTPTLIGSDGRSYPDFGLTQCGVEMTESGYRGETDLAKYTVEGNATRFTVTGVSKADIRQTVVLSCLTAPHDGIRYSIVTANW
jgi:hypothetical protein